MHRFVLIGLLAGAVGFGCSRSPLAPAADGKTRTDTGSHAARGGNKPPSEIPAIAWFRCPGPGCTGDDRITGDGAPYAVAIGGDGNLRVSLSDPSRTITFDYADCLSPCPDGNRWFTAYAAPANEVYMHTSVLVPGTETESQHGMLDIPVGDTWFSRIKMSFQAANPDGQTVIFGLRFNPFFAGSTNLRVTRVTEDQWVVEAQPADVAWAASLSDQTSKGKPPKDGGELFEGNYRLPFAITVIR